MLVLQEGQEVCLRCFIAIFCDVTLVRLFPPPPAFYDTGPDEYSLEYTFIVHALLRLERKYTDNKIRYSNEYSWEQQLHYAEDQRQQTDTKQNLLHFVTGNNAKDLQLFASRYMLLVVVHSSWTSHISLFFLTQNTHLWCLVHKSRHGNHAGS